jgi:TRAP-type C4-dicarboxylate transport system permease small subunit
VMILDVALGIVLGVVMLVGGFYALAWIVNWWQNHWETALLFGIPLGWLVYAAVTDNPSGMGWAGLLLIGAILVHLWRQYKAKVRARERIQREAQEWHDAWETHRGK